jgi:ABC-2 type transport system permease protein
VTSLSWQRALTVARREFLTTVRRKAFLLTLVGTPAYFAVVMFITAGTELKQRDEALAQLSAIGVVDSSGLYRDAEREISTEIRASEDNPFAGRRPVTGPGRTYRTTVHFFDDWQAGERALRAHEVSQVLVVPADYLQSGAVRRYARSSGFSSADRRALSAWLARNLVRGRVDPSIAARVARPTENEALFTLAKDGRFELKDDAREIADFMLPMMFSMLLGVCIIIGGQYLLQGVAEEKESRILESLLCTVSAEELMTGKLLGLGGVGLAVVGLWSAAGLVFVGPMLVTLGIAVPAAWIGIGVLYFLLGYLFFGSIMTGIGGVTNNMREAQQFAVWFTFANFVPFILMMSILSHPDSAVAVALSLFPPTAATAMMLRMTAPSAVVPAWQIALSLALLAGAAWLGLRAAARIFRIGLLMYGKTPNLPEILRWARAG